MSEPKKLRLLEVAPGSGDDPLQLRYISAEGHSTPYIACAVWTGEEEVDHHHHHPYSSDEALSSYLTNSDTPSAMRDAIYQLRDAEKHIYVWIEQLCGRNYSGTREDGDITGSATTAYDKEIYTAAQETVVWAGRDWCHVEEEEYLDLLFGHETSEVVEHAVAFATRLADPEASASDIAQLLDERYCLHRRPSPSASTSRSSGEENTKVEEKGIHSWAHLFRIVTRAVFRHHALLRTNYASTLPHISVIMASRRSRNTTTQPRLRIPLATLQTASLRLWAAFPMPYFLAEVKSKHRLELKSEIESEIEIEAQKQSPERSPSTMYMHIDKFFLDRCVGNFGLAPCVVFARMEALFADHSNSNSDSDSDSDDGNGNGNEEEEDKQDDINNNNNNNNNRNNNETEITKRRITLTLTALAPDPSRLHVNIGFCDAVYDIEGREWQYKTAMAEASLLVRDPIVFVERALERLRLGARPPSVAVEFEYEFKDVENNMDRNPSSDTDTDIDTDGDADADKGGENTHSPKPRTTETIPTRKRTIPRAAAAAIAVAVAEDQAPYIAPPRNIQKRIPLLRVLPCPYPSSSSSPSSSLSYPIECQIIEIPYAAVPSLSNFLFVTNTTYLRRSSVPSSPTPPASSALSTSPSISQTSLSPTPKNMVPILVNGQAFAIPKLQELFLRLLRHRHYYLVQSTSTKDTKETGPKNDDDIWLYLWNICYHNPDKIGLQTRDDIESHYASTKNFIKRVPGSGVVDMYDVLDSLVGDGDGDGDANELARDELEALGLPAGMDWDEWLLELNE